MKRAGLAIELAFIIGIGTMMMCTKDNSMNNINVDTYMISQVLPVRHFHAFRADTLFFMIHQGESMTPKNGLKPILSWQLKGSTTVNKTALGDIVDKNDGTGTYFWAGKFCDAGFYTLTLSVEVDGITFSNAFGPYEVSKAGGEKIFCPDATNPQYNYQVRWEAKPGILHGNDTAAFEVEIKRSINTPVNTTAPNIFDHIMPSDLTSADSLPTIRVASASGEDSLAVTYKGLGIYRVVKVLPAVTTATTFWLHISFTDECGNVDEGNSTSPDYLFPVLPR